MHIDFAPPSKGTYNNAGSSRQLANYLEHEDLERMEKDIYTEGFFNLTDDNIYKSMVIKDIDSNIGQLLKTDAKFYATHVSPSEKELRAMGSTEKEQAEAMKRYIREVFIPEYAKNFNKELSASDIKFYGKIHFNRSRSDNELNMHCHLIVSRKDQSNKKKLSPLTNHKNTKNGVIKGHEFHYFDSTDSGTACIARKPSTGRGYECIKSGEHYFLGFPHLYYPSNPEFVEKLVQKAKEYRRSRMVEE